MGCPCKLALRDLRNLGKTGVTFITKFDFITPVLSPFSSKNSLHCNCIFKNKTKACIKAHKFPLKNIFDFHFGEIRTPYILYEMCLIFFNTKNIINKNLN